MVETGRVFWDECKPSYRIQKDRGAEWLCQFSSQVTYLTAHYGSGATRYGSRLTDRIVTKLAL
jgi:hypothetical protein